MTRALTSCACLTLAGGAGQATESSAAMRPTNITESIAGVVVFAPIGAGVGLIAGSLSEAKSARRVVIYRP
jgi:hypothetical protein